MCRMYGHNLDTNYTLFLDFVSSSIVFCEARFLNYFVSILCVIFDIYLYSIIYIQNYIVSRNAFKSRSPVALAPNTIKARIAAVSLMCR